MAISTTKTSEIYSFPDYNIPDSKKDADYHKKFAQAIIYRSIDTDYNLNYYAMTESYEFFNGINTGDEFAFLQSAEDGDVLPAKWINFNKIRTKVKLLLGELITKGYDIDVRTINKEAEIRKRLSKDDAIVDYKMNSVARDLEENYGLAFGYNAAMPETEEEFLEQYSKKKENAEIIMEELLKAVARKNNWTYTRMALFRDIMITGRAFVRCEIINGKPSIRRIDPRMIVFDINATDDLLSDSTYWGELRYMSVADAAEKYGLSAKEIEKAYKDYKELGPNNPIRKSFDILLEDGRVKYYRQERGELRVLVATSYWQDTISRANKYSEDQFGNMHIKKVPETKKGPNIKKKRYKVWRTATLVGHDIIKDWGVMENMVGSVDDMNEIQSPYIGLIPDFVDYRSISIVDQLKGLQKLKDIVMYRLQLDISRAGSKTFVYDIAQIPDGWDIETALKYIKMTGITFIDSMKDGIPANYNQFHEVDLSLSDSVNKYVEISFMIDQEMDRISGINEARQGITQGQNQTVGVTQSALFQSNMITKPLFDGFLNFTSKIFSYISSLCKYIWKDTDSIAGILSYSDVDVIDADINIDLQDYVVDIQETNLILDDIQMFHQMVLSGLQSGALSFTDAMMLLREKDPDIAYKKMQRIEARRQKEQAEQEAAMAAQHQQAIAAQQQAQLAQQQSQQQAQLAAQSGLQGAKDAEAMRREQLKSRTNIAEKLIDRQIKKENIGPKEKPKK
jgi:hypothetical protein